MFITGFLFVLFVMVSQFTCIPRAFSFLHESLLNFPSHFLNEVCCINHISYTELFLPSRDTSHFVMSLVLFLLL